MSEKRRAWLKKVDEDLSASLKAGNVENLLEVLGESLGRQVMVKAVRTAGLGSPGLSSSSATAATPAAPGTHHCILPLWTQDLRYDATLNATVHRTRESPRMYDLTVRHVPKDVHLRFELSTNVPAPFDLHWQVVNTGPEAERAGQLRGEIEDADHVVDLVRWERTAYSGAHWVEAFMMKGGYCVARTGRKYVRVEA